MARRLVEAADLMGEKDDRYGLPIQMLQMIKDETWQTTPFINYFHPTLLLLAVPPTITELSGFQLPPVLQKWLGGHLGFGLGLALWLFDDAATGIGMQAREYTSQEFKAAIAAGATTFPLGIEGNPHKNTHVAMADR